MVRERVVKVSDEEYAMLQKLRQELIHKGSERLPDELRIQVDQQGRTGDFALGALIGLGAAAFLYLLSEALTNGDRIERTKTKISLDKER